MRITVILIYVDDIIMTMDDKEEKPRLKRCLAKEFEINELRKHKYLLIIEVTHSKLGIFIS